MERSVPKGFPHWRAKRMRVEQAEAEFRRQAARYRAAEAELASARRDLRAAMLSVREGRQMTLEEMGKVLGVTRQRVRDIVRGT